MTICIDQLPPELRRIQFAQSNVLCELDKVQRLRESCLPEGLAFYAGRVLEASAHEVVARLKFKPSNKAFDNLELMAATGCVDDGYLACGHALRRIATDARHMLRPIGGDEQDTIIALLQLWIEWLAHFITGQAYGETPAQLSTPWSAATEMVRSLVDGSPEQLNNWVDDRGLPDTRLLKDSSTAAFLCERITDARHPAADALTLMCADKFKSVRFLQLRALYLSRNHRAQEAISYLLPTLRRRFGDDAETLGILGGASKNLWLKDRNLDRLQDARKYYQRTPGDGKSSYYLLINAAATALWLGEEPQARALAYQSQERLKEFGLNSQWAHSPLASYWIVATLAEAQLIGRNFKLAKKLYERAKALDHTGGRWTRTQEQLRVHLEFLSDARALLASLV
jgi:hypothetical protein